MKVCAIADLHSNLTLKTPDADVLVVAGDLTYRGSMMEISNVRHWLKEQPQKYKVVIAGNHDFCFENHYKEEAKLALSGDNIFYLQDESIILEGIKFYGTPWQPWFYDWAFNLVRGQQLRNKWDLIPDDTDVLITHGPPHGYGDRTVRGDRVGCEDLIQYIKTKKPRYNVFGHIHEDIGEWEYCDSKLINCSVGYRINDCHPDGFPVVFDIEPRK